MATYKIKLAYDGTNYGGWQIQPNAPSIQELLQSALRILLKKETNATGAGRTDAGVHAMAQCAHFSGPDDLDMQRTQRSLNGILPPEIRVLEIEAVPDSFHARYSAVRKIYRYNINLGPIASPFQRSYAWHFPYPFSYGPLKEGAKLLTGTHDFCSFANVRVGGENETDTVRTIYRIDIVHTTDGFYLEYEGNGFLYKMVRNLTGCLMEVGGGKYPPEHINHILEARDRRTAGQAAPAKGLFLVEVIY